MNKEKGNDKKDDNNNNNNNGNNHLLCPKRPILLALDENGNDVPLNSSQAFRTVTRFGRCLDKMCALRRYCKNGE